MVLATKKNCQRVLAASLRVVSAMTGNPPLRGQKLILQISILLSSGCACIILNQELKQRSKMLLIKTFAILMLFCQCACAKEMIYSRGNGKLKL